MYKTLAKGSGSFDVLALQQLINRANKDTSEKQLAVDHDFGPGTKAALVDFQRKAGIEANGVCDLVTWQALYKATDVNILELKNFVYAGLSSDQYKTEYKRKDIIVLHHTAGGPNPYYLRDYFQKYPSQVATAYGIGGKGKYDGVILQLFEHPSQWAYHLNIWGNFKVYGDRKSDNKSHETRMTKRTVAVEVCNYGYLSFLDGDFWFMVRGKKSKKVPKEDVIDYGEKGYREKRYYHRYTNKQIATLKDFILKTAAYYHIDLDKPEGGFCKKWFDYSWDATRGNQNIFSHSSVRSKSDMHPQPELLDMLNNL